MSLPGPWLLFLTRVGWSRACSRRRRRRRRRWRRRRRAPPPRTAWSRPPSPKRRTKFASGAPLRPATQACVCSAQLPICRPPPQPMHPPDTSRTCACVPAPRAQRACSKELGAPPRCSGTRRFLDHHRAIGTNVCVSYSVWCRWVVEVQCLGVELLVVQVLARCLLLSSTRHWLFTQQLATAQALINAVPKTRTVAD